MHEFRTNVYGLARTLLATGTLVTLVATPAASLFMAGQVEGEIRECVGIARYSLFCLITPRYYEFARWSCVAGLAVVASGWHPRITGIPHWWLSFSFMSAATVLDGGDHLTAILTLLLVPAALADPRRSHWHTPRPRSQLERTTMSYFLMSLPALVALFAIRVQTSAIYLQAAAAKTGVEEWRDGTATFYWFTHPTYGVSPFASAAVGHLLAQPLAVLSTTWGAILLEFFLFAGLTMDRKLRPFLLTVGVLFHVGIAVVHGLISFTIVMWAALVLYLWPIDKPFALHIRSNAAVDGILRQFARFTQHGIASRGPFFRS